LTTETLAKEAKESTVENNPKNESVKSSNDQVKISVCDVMKDNTSKVIKKMESQIPSYVQEYSDIYTEYLHMFDDLFGTCYISEKEFFDKLGFDQETLKTFDNYSKTLTNFYSSQIDMSTNFLREYVKMRISGIKSYDKNLHVMMDSYAKMLSQYNATIQK
jgi:hydroxylamine reductase (hybrid-cluster protein)